MTDIKIKVPDKHIFLSFDADAVLIRYLQKEFRQMPDGKGSSYAEAMEKHLQECTNRQNFFILISDDPIPHEVIQPDVRQVDDDFISEGEMGV